MIDAALPASEDRAAERADWRTYLRPAEVADLDALIANRAKLRAQVQALNRQINGHRDRAQHRRLWREQQAVARAAGQGEAQV